MNFKKTWKRFWTLSRSSEGFTLVELIVVIAILAILAGIAVPAYSGYIKKANKAADLQLLGAVNTAFAAAALENNVDVNEITGNVYITMGGEAGARTVAAINPYDEAFQRYYAGNTTTAFKVIESLWFNPLTHSIEENETNSFTYGSNGSVSLSQQDIYNFVQSTYADMGADGLTGKIDYVTTLAAELMSGDLSNTTFAQLIAGPEYGTLLAGNLGIDLTAEGGVDEFTATVGGMVDDKMDLLIASGAYSADADRSEGSDLYNAAYNQIVANNAVLNAASNSASVSDDILTVLGSGNATTEILQTINSNSGEGLAQAAMAYGLYTAYAEKTGATVPDDPSEVLGLLDGDTGFKTYLGTSQAQTDLDGYMAAMNMINTNVATNTDAVSDILVNGFANDDLVALIQTATGIS